MAVPDISWWFDESIGRVSHTCFGEYKNAGLFIRCLAFSVLEFLVIAEIPLNPQ